MSLTPKNRRSFLSLLFVTAVDSYGFGIIFVMFAPLLLSPQYGFVPYETSAGMRNLYLALLFAAFPLTQLFGAPILGDIADRAGRKKALYISILGVVFGSILSAIACIFYNLILLFVSRLISGFFAGNMSICMSGIADLSPTEKIRSRNFGLITVVWGITWNLAMLSGGYLSDPSHSKYFSPALPFWITAALTLLSLFILKIYYTETHPTKAQHPFNIIKGLHNIAHTLKIKEVRIFFLIVFIWTVGWGLGVQWFAAYGLTEYKASQQFISLSLFIQGFFWMLGGSLFNPVLLRKYRSLTIALIGSIFVTLFLYLTLFTNSFLTFSIIYWLAASFSSFAFSNSMNLVSIHAPEAVQGKIMGLNQSMMAFGWIITPLIGGAIGAKNPSLFYIIAASILALNVLLLIWAKIKHM